MADIILDQPTAKRVPCNGVGKVWVGRSCGSDLEMVRSETRVAERNDSISHAAQGSNKGNIDVQPATVRQRINEKQPLPDS